MREKRAHKEERLAEAKRKKNRGNAELQAFEKLDISDVTDESANISSTSTDDTDTTSRSSLAVSLGKHNAPGAIELLRSRRKVKKERKIVLASQNFKAEIKSALNHTYPRIFMEPKGILYRLPGNQQRRCIADTLER